MKVFTLSISLFVIVMASSCGHDGQTKCEKAKEIALKGYQKYCAGKEEMCGSCHGCDGDLEALTTIWNEYGTDLITICVTDSPYYECVVHTRLDVDICQCEGSNLEWAESCLEDVDSCRQNWMGIAQDFCAQSMN